MAYTNHITKEYLNEIFEYKDGSIYWKKKIANCINIGTKAGTSVYNEYSRVFVSDKSYLIHRLVFLMHNGYLPEMVDHIDGIKSNNRIENLRATTRSQNLFNSKLSKSNSTGSKNVSYEAGINKFIVTISVKKKFAYVGYFDDLELADLVAHMAREKYHGIYARHK